MSADSAPAPALAPWLRAEPGPLLAVVDAARSPKALAVAREIGREAESLFAGRRGERLDDAAPWLVRLPEGPAREDLASAVAGRSSAVFLRSGAPFATIQGHLRRCLTAETEDGRALFFRFYDPRVLPSYLESSTDAERARLFGPVDTFLVEADRELLRFERPFAPSPGQTKALIWIRDVQRERLLAEAEARRVARLRRWVERRHPERAASLGREQLDAAIRAHVARAEHHGLSDDGSILRFVEAMARLGPDFDQRLPWAKRLLAREDLAPRAKAKRLLGSAIRRAGPPAEE